MWWHTPVILALGRLRQADHFKFQTALDYVARSCLTKLGEKKDYLKFLFSKFCVSGMKRRQHVLCIELVP